MNVNKKYRPTIRRVINLKKDILIRTSDYGLSYRFFGDTKKIIKEYSEIIDFDNLGWEIIYINNNIYMKYSGKIQKIDIEYSDINLIRVYKGDIYFCKGVGSSLTKSYSKYEICKYTNGKKISLYKGIEQVYSLEILDNGTVYASGLFSDNKYGYISINSRNEIFRKSSENYAIQLSSDFLKKYIYIISPGDNTKIEIKSKNLNSVSEKILNFHIDIFSGNLMGRYYIKNIKYGKNIGEITFLDGKNTQIMIEE